MRKLGEQWIEVIDGKKHMLKAVLQPKQQSRLYNGNDTHPCFKCFFQMDDYDCAYPSDKWVCDMQRGVIIKDLGILNENGVLPCPFCGSYPELFTTFWQNASAISCTSCGCTSDDEYKSLQQAIDAWNRRV